MHAIVDYKVMNRVGQILAKNHGILTNVIRIRHKWDEIAGDVLASHTEPVQLKGKTLYVLCDSPVWVQQVGILGPTLQPRIKTIAGIRVDKVSGTFGMGYKPSEKVRVRPKIGRLDIDPGDIEKIADPQLRSVLQELVEIQGDDNG